MGIISKIATAIVIVDIFVAHLALIYFIFNKIDLDIVILALLFLNVAIFWLLILNLIIWHKPIFGMAPGIILSVENGGKRSKKVVAEPLWQWLLGIRFVDYANPKEKPVKKSDL